MCLPDFVTRIRADFFHKKGEEHAPDGHVSEVHTAGEKKGVVYVLRHGEKSSLTGCLDAAGKGRAASYPGIFDTQNKSNDFETPKAVFAFRYKECDRGGSIFQGSVRGCIINNCQRTLETIQPTATKLNLKVFNEGNGDSNMKAAKDILVQLAATGGPVIVDWESKNIQYLTRALGVPVDKIQRWPKTDFDSVYVFTFNLDSTPALISLEYKTAGVGNPRLPGDRQQAFFVPGIDGIGIRRLFDLF
jgi:hypothetical protein